MAARDKQAENPVALDLREVSTFTDYFLVCHGQNRRQVQAISDHIEESLAKRKMLPRHIEGYPNGEWVLLDYSDVVIHVFNRERRDSLQLEKLWGDAPRLEIPENPGEP